MFKKIIVVLLFVACGAFAEWAGLMDKPDTRLVDDAEYYVIKSAEHLAWFANEVNLGSKSLKAILDTNIIFGANAYTKCTKNWTPMANFSGVIDGNGYTIFGLNVSESNAGLVGTLSGTIKNLTIAYSSFTASGASGIAGAFAGTNSGTISNCVNEKSPVYGYAYGGGITGKNFGSIQNSANKSTVSADYYNGHAGGIAGSNTKNISNCSNSGTISYSGTSGQYNYIGGIVGDNSGSVVSCKNTGAVTGIYAGGIVGYATAGSVQKSSNSGTIRGYNIGGIVGYVKSSISISNCANYGNLSGDSYGASGGIAGYMTGSTTLSFSTASSITVGYSGVKGSLYGNLYGNVQYAYYDSRSSLGAYGIKNQYASTSNVSSMTTANMQKDLFAWNLNTKFGTLSNSGIWCRTNGYPQIADANCKATRRVIFDNNGQKTTIYTNSQGQVSLPANPVTAEDQVFMGWFNEETPITDKTVITQDITAKAVFANKEDLFYSVRFFNADSTLLDSLYLQYETIPEWEGIANKDPSVQYTYAFIGWDKEIIPVTGDADYYAIYDSTVRKYEIVFMDFDNSILQKDSIVYGEIPSGIQAPERSATKKFSYQFKSWSPEISTVVKDAQYKALYDSTQFSCTIHLDMEDFSMEYSIGCGNLFTLPSVPEKDGYTFEGWFHEGEKLGVAGDEIEILEDLAISANYSENSDNKTGIVFHPALSHFSVTVHAHQLQISNAVVGSKYFLFNPQGKVLLQGNVTSSHFSLVGMQPGHYLIRIGKSTRVIVIQ